jgi:hypothetical protein
LHLDRNRDLINLDLIAALAAEMAVAVAVAEDASISAVALAEDQPGAYPFQN